MSDQREELYAINKTGAHRRLHDGRLTEIVNDADNFYRPEIKSMAQELLDFRVSPHIERVVTLAAIGALRRALATMNLGLSQSQTVAVDEVASREIREAIADAFRVAKDRQP